MKRTILTLLSALLIACMLIPAAISEEIAVEPLDAPVAVEETVIDEDAELPTEDAEPDAEIGNDLQQYESAEVENPSYDAAMGPLYAPEGSLPIDEAHFPDATFRECLNSIISDMWIPDENDNRIEHIDGYIMPVEMARLQRIDVRREPIKSLEGLQYLPNVEELIAYQTNITSLDLSSLSKLTYISLDFCQNLTSLNLGALPDLSALHIVGCNNLASVDISQCSTLLSNIAGWTPTKETGYWSSVGEDIEYWSWGTSNKEEAFNIEYSENTQIITEASSTPSTSSTPETSSTGANTTIPANKKVVTTVELRGSKILIDTGSQVGSGFKSSNKKVATVDKTGMITVKGAGKTNITYKLNKKNHTLKLTIKDPTIPGKVTLSLSGTQKAKKGDKVTLTATLPEGTVSGIKWTTSDKKTATVKNGVVTFKKAGKVTITATATRGKKKAKVSFKVSK